MNLEAVTSLLKFLIKHIEEGYIFCSIDESGFGSKALRRYGWAKKGERASISYTRLKNTTLLSCISPIGTVAY